MAQTVEFDLAKVLEDLRQDIKENNKETNRKLDKVIENQTRLEEKIIKLEAKTENLQSGIDAINVKLNSQNTWLLSLLTGLIIGVLTLVAAVGKVVFFPNP